MTGDFSQGNDLNTSGGMSMTTVNFHKSDNFVEGSYGYLVYFVYFAPGLCHVDVETNAQKC